MMINFDDDDDDDDDDNDDDNDDNDDIDDIDDKSISLSKYIYTNLMMMYIY